MASASPVFGQPSALVINTLDPLPVPPSVQVVIIPETTTNQPTNLLPEPQESLDRTRSTSSNRLLGSVTATTDSTSSGTSAAAETSPSSDSSVSDQPGQQHALPFRDGRMRPLEDFPAEDEAGPVVLSTELEEVSPDRGPTTGGVRIIILGKNFPSGRLYARFGDFITCTVSEALHWLGTELTGCWADSAE